MVTKSKCHRAVLVSHPDDDWEGLYFDGKLCVEGHSLYVSQVFEALIEVIPGLTTESIERHFECRLPENLSELEERKPNGR